MIQAIHPSNESEWLLLRTKDITSTEAAALFGISPYMTKFELWHRKKSGDVVKLEGNERMKWGTRLQDAIAAGVAEEQGWHIRRMDEYIRDDELRVGASFDFSIESDDAWKISDMPTKNPHGSEGLLEIKNVDALQYREGWHVSDDGNIEAPLHIEIQVQHQLLVSNRAYAYIGALIGGNRLILIKRTRDEGVISRIKDEVKAFWASIEANNPPSPDFIADAQFIKSLYKHAEPGTIYDARGNNQVSILVEQDKALAATIKEAQEKRDAIKAQLLTIIGDSEKVLGDGYSIDAGITGESPRNFIMPAFRRFKISYKKTNGKL